MSIMASIDGDDVHEFNLDDELELLPIDSFDPIEVPLPAPAPAEIQANSRFLSEPVSAGRGPRFSNPTIERMNSFKYRNAPKEIVKHTINEPAPISVLDPRQVHQSGYNLVETRQRSAVPATALRKLGSPKSSESLVQKSITSPPRPPNNMSTPPANPPKMIQRPDTVEEEPTKVKPQPVTEVISTKKPVTPAPQPRATTPNSQNRPSRIAAPRPVQSVPSPAVVARDPETPPPVSAPRNRSAPRERVSIFKRPAPTTELMSPIRARNAAEASAAATSSSRPTTPTPVRSVTPTLVKRSPRASVGASMEASVSGTKSEGGGWNSSVKVKGKTPVDDAVESIIRAKQDSGEKAIEKPRRHTPLRSGAGSYSQHDLSKVYPRNTDPVPPRSSQFFSPNTSTSRSGTPTSRSAGSRSTTPTVNSRPVSRSTTPSIIPQRRRPSLGSYMAGDDVSEVSRGDSLAHSQRSASGRSPGRHSAPASASLLSPYNLMVSGQNDRSLDSERMSDADLKTVGNQMLLLKLMLQQKATEDAASEEEDILRAWQIVHATEEQARSLANHDVGIDEIVKVHQQIHDMEIVVDRVNDHLAPVFERLSSYLHVKSDLAEEHCNGADPHPEDKAQSHRELQARLVSLSKSIANLKRSAEQGEFVAPAAGHANHNGTHNGAHSRPATEPVAVHRETPSKAAAKPVYIPTSKPRTVAAAPVEAPIKKVPVGKPVTKPSNTLLRPTAASIASNAAPVAQATSPAPVKPANRASLGGRTPVDTNKKDVKVSPKPVSKVAPKTVSTPTPKAVPSKATPNRVSVVPAAAPAAALPNEPAPKTVVRAKKPVAAVEETHAQQDSRLGASEDCNGNGAAEENGYHNDHTEDVDSALFAEDKEVGSDLLLSEAHEDHVEDYQQVMDEDNCGAAEGVREELPAAEEIAEEEAAAEPEVFVQDMEYRHTSSSAAAAAVTITTHSEPAESVTVLEEVPYSNPAADQETADAEQMEAEKGVEPVEGYEEGFSGEPVAEERHMLQVESSKQDTEVAEITEAPPVEEPAMTDVVNELETVGTAEESQLPPEAAGVQAAIEEKVTEVTVFTPVVAADMEPDISTAAPEPVVSAQEPEASSPETPQTSVDAHLNSMFELQRAESEDAAADVGVKARPAHSTAEHAAYPVRAATPERVGAGQSAMAAQSSDAEKAAPVEIVEAGLKSPERKARGEAFARLMKRMNQNKEDAASSQPVSRASTGASTPVVPAEIVVETAAAAEPVAQTSSEAADASEIAKVQVEVPSPAPVSVPTGVLAELPADAPTEAPAELPAVIEVETAVVTAVPVVALETTDVSAAEHIVEPCAVVESAAATSNEPAGTNTAEAQDDIPAELPMENLSADTATAETLAVSVTELTLEPTAAAVDLNTTTSTSYGEILSSTDSAAELPSPASAAPASAPTAPTVAEVSSTIPEPAPAPEAAAEAVAETVTEKVQDVIVEKHEEKVAEKVTEKAQPVETRHKKELSVITEAEVPAVAVVPESPAKTPGIRALLNKFEEKKAAAEAGASGAGIQSTPTTPVAPGESAQRFTPKREKSSRLTELMSKFDGAKKESPVPSFAPGRGNVRSSIVAIGDITPKKAVFEKDFESPAEAASSSAESLHSAAVEKQTLPTVLETEAGPVPVEEKGNYEKPALEAHESTAPQQVSSAEETVHEYTKPALDAPYSQPAQVEAPADYSKPAQPEAQSEPEPDTQPQSTPQPEAQSEPESVIAGSKPAPPEAQPEPETQPQPIPQPEPQPEPEPVIAGPDTPAAPTLSFERLPAPSSDSLRDEETGSNQGSELSTASKKARRPTLKGLWKRVKSATGMTADGTGDAGSQYNDSPVPDNRTSAATTPQPTPNPPPQPRSSVSLNDFFSAAVDEDDYENDSEKEGYRNAHGEPSPHTADSMYGFGIASAGDSQNPIDADSASIASSNHSKTSTKSKDKSKTSFKGLWNMVKSSKKEKP